MPTFGWIGKKAMVNHHRDVPHLLIHRDKDNSVGDLDAGLVQGDGFTGLRAVYEDGCKVPDERLSDLGLTFKQISHQVEGF
jgi:hypothetical protein